MDNTTVLKAEAISKVYGANKNLLYKALDGIDLHIKKGEFVGIMGPSGSGKTTLLNILATIDKPTSGKLEINGAQPYALPEKQLALFRRRELGFIFQDFNLLDTLSVRDNILLPLVLENMPLGQMEERLEQSAGLLGISDLLKKRTYEISGGQKQRTAIARAMIHRPSILLADELTGSLDSKAAKDVMESLEQLNAELGSTILMVTHDPFAASFCRRIVFIRDGRLFSEIRRGPNRNHFFQEILDMLSVLGGNFNDVSPARL